MALASAAWFSSWRAGAAPSPIGRPARPRPPFAVTLATSARRAPPVVARSSIATVLCVRTSSSAGVVSNRPPLSHPPPSPPPPPVHGLRPSCPVQCLSSVVCVVEYAVVRLPARSIQLTNPHTRAPTRPPLILVSASFGALQSSAAAVLYRSRARRRTRYGHTWFVGKAKNPAPDHQSTHGHAKRERETGRSPDERGPWSPLFAADLAAHDPHHGQQNGGQKACSRSGQNRGDQNSPARH